MLRVLYINRALYAKPSETSLSGCSNTSKHNSNQTVLKGPIDEPMSMSNLSTKRTVRPSLESITGKTRQLSSKMHRFVCRTCSGSCTDSRVLLELHNNAYSLPLVTMCVYGCSKQILMNELCRHDATGVSKDACISVYNKMVHIYHTIFKHTLCTFSHP